MLLILRCFFFYFTAQKSFYQAKHKEVSTELQTKTSQLEESKKRIIALENESLAKQAEVKKVKRELEQKTQENAESHKEFSKKLLTKLKYFTVNQKI